LVTYYDDLDLKNFVDYVQEEFQCCGGIYFKDWAVNPYHNCTFRGPSACGVPYTCCVRTPGSININTMCGYGTIGMEIVEAVELIYTKGCIDGVLDYLWTNLDIFGAILIGVLLPQVTGIWLCLSYRLVLHEVIEFLHEEQARLKSEQIYMLNRDEVIEL